jgi:hypothetical protein
LGEKNASRREWVPALQRKAQKSINSECPGLA